MKETPQEYTQRILGYIGGKNPMDIIAAVPRKVERLVKGVTKKRLRKRPAPEKWSVTEILAHLADAEIVWAFRIRLILGSSGTVIQGYDQDVWAGYSDYPSNDPALSLECWRVNRQSTLRLLKGLTKEQWQFFGMHSERGKETVTRVSEMMAGHDINHFRQIEGILKG
jgi:hypothetical protein